MYFFKVNFTYTNLFSNLVKQSIAETIRVQTTADLESILIQIVDRYLKITEP